MAVSLPSLCMVRPKVHPQLTMDTLPFREASMAVSTQMSSKGDGSDRVRRKWHWTSNVLGPNGKQHFVHKVFFYCSLRITKIVLSDTLQTAYLQTCDSRHGLGSVTTP